MYIMYVDESGGPGNSPLSSPHYILTGLIIHQDEWKPALIGLKLLRQNLDSSYGLKLRTEFHTSEIFRAKADAYKSIKKSARIEMLKHYVNKIPKIFSSAKLLNICFRKADQPHVNNFQELAWNRFLNRFDTFLKKTAKDKGIIICDESNENQLRINCVRAESIIQFPLNLTQRRIMLQLKTLSKISITANLLCLTSFRPVTLLHIVFIGRSTRKAA